MAHLRYIPITKAARVKSYLFKVVFEKDIWLDEPHWHALWRVYIPALPGAHAWGNTQQEALENLKNAVDLVIGNLLEEGNPIPADPSSYVQPCDEPLLVITV